MIDGEEKRNKKKRPLRLVTRFVVKLLQHAVHPVLGADGALLGSHWQAGEPRPQEHRLGLHLVDLCQQLSIKKLNYVPLIEYLHLCFFYQKLIDDFLGGLTNSN